MNKFFKVDRDTGWVYTRKKLDYEKQSVYNLTIVASDQGEPPKSASFGYRIEVEDENEYPPVFAKNLKREFEIPSNLRKGQKIGQV